MENHSAEHSSPSRVGRYITYAIITLAVALVFLLFFLVRDYRTLRREQVINAHEMWLAAVVKNHGHLTAGEAGEVRSWMTFDYVSKLFDLPPDYIKNTLTITDVRYPRLTLSGYAKSEHVTSAVIVNEVEDAIRNYVATSTQATASVQ